MLVYHGSKNKFDLFSYDKIGLNGTTEGVGFYFTDNKSIAEGYADKGFLYTVEFNGKKSLSNDKITISRTDLKKYLLAINKKNDYLSNWGDVHYDGELSVANLAVRGEMDSCDNDIDLIAGICHASGDTESCLITLYEILGYDSAVVTADWGNQNVYIALINDIIEIKNIEKR